MLFFIVFGSLLITTGLVWLVQNMDSNTPLGIIIVGVGCIFAGTVFAHDQNRPGLDQWYMSLQSGNGYCCGGPTVDATTLDGPDWESKEGGFRVRLYGSWHDVPPEAVVDQPNLDGRALVWPTMGLGGLKIRCFMPGVLT